ncbi:MAG: exonuclease domain-containing protein [Gaiellaceae bacterium]|nr:exonuclease domain-containing protein [Gaiellaceae bacterium]
MQLAVDAADRLVELVERRHGAVGAEEAARVLFALERVPAALARSLRADVVAGDARLAWSGPRVVAAGQRALDVPLEEVELAVVDLETTGLSARRDRICELAAVRVVSFELRETLETLVDPRVDLPAAVSALTGISPQALRRAPSVDVAVQRLRAFVGGSPLAAHNARFDLAFLDCVVERLTGRRIASPVLDTVWLARRLLAGRAERCSLAELARFFGTSATPCHRALPDALATAEVLVRLLGLAQERGARTLADVLELSAPRERRLHGKRSLVAGAPARPGVYLFRDREGTVLYVGKARDLRARLRSYFGGARQRPAIEAALGALARVEWRVLGSELEAALEELRLLQELRPPANARGTRPDRALYLARANGRWRVVSEPTPLGPVPSRRRALLAARALDRLRVTDPAAALPPLRDRLRALARAERFEDAARLRDRIAALEEVLERARTLERLRSARLCVLAPSGQPGLRRAFFVAGGRIVTVRTLQPGRAGALEVRTGLALAAEAAAAPSFEAADAHALLVLDGFLRHPAPELQVVPLAEEAILAA